MSVVPPQNCPLFFGKSWGERLAAAEEALSRARPVPWIVAVGALGGYHLNLEKHELKTENKRNLSEFVDTFLLIPILVGLVLRSPQRRCSERFDLRFLTGHALSQ